MTKNPIINALSAAGYIVIVASIMRGAEKYLSHEPDTIFAPITLISLFTLSAAVMGYIFLSNPLQLYLDGKKKEGVNLFVKTLLSFAVITIVSLTITFSSAL